MSKKKIYYLSIYIYIFIYYIEEKRKRNQKIKSKIIFHIFNIRRRFFNIKKEKNHVTFIF